ncbi:MAG: GNAT family N-acetyltransferase [Acidimicrobiales bacterium]
MRVSSLGFLTDLMVRRLAGSEVADRDDYIVVRTPTNPGFWWGNFVLAPGTVGQGDLDDWVRTFRSELPAAAHVAIGVDSSAAVVLEPAHLEAAGLVAEVSTVLTASTFCQPSAIPSAVVCRPLDGEEDWAQLLALKLAVAADEGHRSEEHRRFLVGQVNEATFLSATGSAVFYGALVEGHLVASLGVVTDGSGLGRYQSVETHPAHRRQGMARTLVRFGGADAHDRLGARTLVIVADPNGPAIDLYHSVGFVDTECQVELSRSPAAL